MANKSISKHNVAAINRSGKVGTVRYYQRGGETYVRSSHNSVKNNPRTDAQMRHRIMFASKAAHRQPQNSSRICGSTPTPQTVISTLRKTSTFSKQ